MTPDRVNLILAQAREIGDLELRAGQERPAGTLQPPSHGAGARAVQEGNPLTSATRGALGAWSGNAPMRFASMATFVCSFNL
jgi:hypothetical protein